MVRRLFAIYALAILFELVGLSWRYASDPPASSSAFSVGLGWAALVSMVVMLVYSIARRSKALRNIARLSTWLHFHIFLGIQGMIFAVFHSLHIFSKPSIQLLNPAVLNLIAVAIVFFSGIFGRFLYSFIPRTIGGERRALAEIETEMRREVTSGLTDEKGRLEKRLATLARADRVFQLWIILHRPLASIMYVLSFLHVALSYMFAPSLGAGG